MPYRLDPYDAMASLAVTSDTYFYEPPLCSYAYAIRRPPRRGGAPTLKSWPVAPADVFHDEVPERKSTAGRQTPACTLQSRRYTFTASERRHRQPAVVVGVGGR
jgi:hypothetical protein